MHLAFGSPETEGELSIALSFARARACDWLWKHGLKSGVDYLHGSAIVVRLVAYLILRPRSSGTVLIDRGAAPESKLYVSQWMDTDPRFFRDRYFAREAAWRLHDACLQW